MDQNLQALFALTDKEQSLLERIFPRLDIKAIIDAFYDHFTQHPSTASFFRGHDLDRLKRGQISHWEKLLKEGPSPLVLAESQKIGETHHRIGVNPDIYLAGYAMVFEHVLTHAINALGMFGSSQRQLVIGAFSRLFMLDIAASLSAYIQSGDSANSAGAMQEIASKTVDNAINASMAINNVFTDALKSSRMAVRVDQQVGSISAAIEEMASTVSTITNNTQKAQGYTAEVNQSATDGQSVSEEAMRSMQGIHDAVAQTSQQAHLLAESSRKIEDIVTRIQTIAHQTNLLALNATIEAARAGAAGKGFTVVASEVKSLSNETSKATQEISEIVSELVDKINAIVGSMERVDKAVASGETVTREVQGRMSEITQRATEVHHLMDEVAHTLQEQSQATSEISGAAVGILATSRDNRETSERSANMARTSSQNVTDMITQIAALNEKDPRIVIKLAKSDHVVWKRKLTDMLLSNSTLSQDEIKDHTQCRLGKWYYGAAKENFGKYPTFQALEAPHQHVHKLGREIYELHQNRQHDTALARLSEMETASEQVVALLNQLDKETA